MKIGTATVHFLPKNTLTPLILPTYLIFIVIQFALKVKQLGRLHKTRKTTKKQRRKGKQINIFQRKNVFNRKQRKGNFKRFSWSWLSWTNPLDMSGLKPLAKIHQADGSVVFLPTQPNSHLQARCRGDCKATRSRRWKQEILFTLRRTPTFSLRTLRTSSVFVFTSSFSHSICDDSISFSCSKRFSFTCPKSMPHRSDNEPWSLSWTRKESHYHGTDRTSGLPQQTLTKIEKKKEKREREREREGGGGGGEYLPSQTRALCLFHSVLK